MPKSVTNTKNLLQMIKLTILARFGFQVNAESVTNSKNNHLHKDSDFKSMPNLLQIHDKLLKYTTFIYGTIIYYKL